MFSSSNRQSMQHVCVYKIVFMCVYVYGVCNVYKFLCIKLWMKRVEWGGGIASLYINLKSRYLWLK